MRHSVGAGQWFFASGRTHNGVKCAKLSNCHLLAFCHQIRKELVQPKNNQGLFLLDFEDFVIRNVVEPTFGDYKKKSARLEVAQKYKSHNRL